MGQPGDRPMIGALGNDIVDLDDAASPSARFLARVLSPEEREWVAHCARPDQLLWHLWAAKEAAYKAIVHKEGTLVFAHARFVVSACPRAIDDDRGARMPREGRVVHGDHVVRVRWTQRDGAISCVGWIEPMDLNGICASISTIDAADASTESLTTRELEAVTSRASRAVRVLAKTLLAEKLGVARARLEIIRPLLSPKLGKSARRGPPEVWLDGERSNRAQLSLSHHGRYVGCAIVAACASGVH